MMIETDQAEIEEAKSKFKVLWEEAKKVETVLGASNKAKSTAKNYFDLFDHYSRNRAKKIFGKLKLKFEIENERRMIEIAHFSSLLAKEESETYIERSHVIMAAILTILREKASSFEEIKKILSEIISSEEIEAEIRKLVEIDKIEREGEKYKINLETLF
ncbi:hypothetical protein AKJ38_03005, partial [candidate division MSBL1 archaeon SCGC-AAA259I14]